MGNTVSSPPSPETGTPIHLVAPGQCSIQTGYTYSRLVHCNKYHTSPRLPHGAAGGGRCRDGDVTRAVVLRTGIHNQHLRRCRPHGDTTASRTLTATTDGQEVASERATLDPGEETTVTVEFEAAPGTVAVEGVEIGTLTVGDQYGGNEPRESGPDDERNAFAAELLVGLVVLLGLVLGALSRIV